MKSVNVPTFARKRSVKKASVDVAADVVALTAVKFWSVEDPVARMFVDESVVVRRSVSVPVVPRNVEAKKFVVVADVPVAFTKVKF